GTFDLKNLNGKNGFAINGIHPRDGLGRLVSYAGDVNGDGIKDVLIATIGVNGIGGKSYVIFGSQFGWPAEINLRYINGYNGFAMDGFINGVASVGGGGDFNGDGIADVIVGSCNTNNQINKIYVLFGEKKFWSASVDVSNLDGENGFSMIG